MSADPNERAVREDGEQPTWRVTLREAGAVFEAPAGRTILASADAAGVSMPSSCRAGTCRTCMHRLVSGSVMYRMEWPGLLADEKAEGWILPCVAFPMTNLVME